MTFWEVGNDLFCVFPMHCVHNEKFNAPWSSRLLKAGELMDNSSCIRNVKRNQEAALTRRRHYDSGSVG